MKYLIIILVVLLPSVVWAECREWRFSEIDSMSDEDLSREIKDIYREGREHLDTAQDYKNSGQTAEQTKEIALANECADRAMKLARELRSRMRRGK